MSGLYKKEAIKLGRSATVLNQYASHGERFSEEEGEKNMLYLNYYKIFKTYWHTLQMNSAEIFSNTV